MRLASTALTAVTLLALAAPASAALPIAVDDQPLPSLAPMIEQVSPAVVNIAVSGSVRVSQNPFFEDPFFRRFFDVPDQPQTRRFRSAGSGVIVDGAEGYILTNHHVVENADEISVTLFDDRTLEATVIGSDAGSDVAVIKVDSEALEQIPLGDSDQLHVGDFVVAIGNPFGFSNTVTSGIVSALGRSGLNVDAYEDFIQTDAAINPGNSGGALLNLRGELVGINSSIISNSGGNLGIGFAIPINMARSIMEQILEFGEVRRGLLGVEIVPVNPGLAEVYGLDEPSGALVRRVSPGSAAEEAGIRTGDVIVAVDGEEVDDASELRNAIGLRRSGERVELALVRDGRRRNLTATLGSLSEARTASTAPRDELDGAQFSELPDSREFRNRSGVLVESVEAGSPAAQSSLQSGDVITKVNRREIANLREFREAVAVEGPVVLTIERGNSELLLIL